MVHCFMPDLFDATQRYRDLINRSSVTLGPSFGVFGFSLTKIGFISKICFEVALLCSFDLVLNLYKLVQS